MRFFSTTHQSQNLTQYRNIITIIRVRFNHSPARGPRKTDKIFMSVDRGNRSNHFSIAAKSIAKPEPTTHRKKFHGSDIHSGRIYGVFNKDFDCVKDAEGVRFCLIVSFCAGISPEKHAFLPLELICPITKTEKIYIGDRAFRIMWGRTL